ncbi:MAG: S41 family peptidase [Bacteroidota bacterium]
MNRAKEFFKRRRNAVVVFSLVFIGLIGISADTNKYFEIAKNLEIFANLYKEINTYYVDDVDPAKLMRTGVDAMLESLDPFTNYISEAEMAGFRLQITGKYGGIGASIRNDGDFVVITEPYENFPAHKAGLMAGDKIISINGKSAKGKTTKEVSDVLKGAPGDEVNLTVRRPGQNSDMNVRLVREEVHIPNVPYSGLIDDETGYIYLTTFSEKAGKNVADALEKLKAEHDIKQVVLDLRGNGGGLLKEAINVSNVFIDKGEEIVSTRGKIKDWDRNFKTLNKPVDTDIPLVVLIDRGSASASEIVSGVIQDLDRGVLVGQKSYGKGLVQNTRDVGYNSKVKLTTAKYYVASGRCIQSVQYKEGEPVEIDDSLKTKFKTRNGRIVFDGGGITPDVRMELEDFSKITQTLMRNNLVFDYATQFRLKNPSIAEAKDFALTDAEYEDFKEWLKDKDYEYETESERLLSKLEETVKKEQYYDAVKGALEDVKQKKAIEKNNDLNKHKDEILPFLEREIVGRYYLGRGKIEIDLKNDPEIDEAMSLFNDIPRYNKILTTSN